MRATIFLFTSALALMAATIANADTITFQDVNDTVTTSTTGSRFFVYPFVGLGPVIVGLSAPTGGTFVSSTLPNLPISAAAGFPNLQYSLVAADPTGTTVSDALVLSTTPNTPATFTLSPVVPFPAPIALFFEADNDASPLLCTTAPHGCQITETGTLQTAGTITWSIPTGATVTDTVQFQVTDTPEPSSLVMLAIGLLFGMVGIKKGLAAGTR